MHTHSRQRDGSLRVMHAGTGEQGCDRAAVQRPALAATNHRLYSGFIAGTTESVFPQPTKHFLHRMACVGNDGRSRQRHPGI